jgi:lipid-A-disaccharide synthase
LRLLVSALEPSANIHLKELKKHLSSEVKFVGIFDKSLGEPIVDLSSSAVMGIVDALKKIRFFLDLKKKMATIAKSCDKVLLMDSSGFNLPLAKELKKLYPNLEINYYILPQAWAWRRGRIKIIEKYCDNLYSILPFEKEYYTKKDKIQYVGHPLLDEIKEYKTSLVRSAKIAYMPGSRRSEIKALMPIFKELSQNIGISKEHILIIPISFKDKDLEEIYGDIEGFSISYDTHKSLYESEFAFICSGTATLEAAIIGTPFILTYKAKKFDYFVGRKIFNIQTIGLANIFFEKMKRDRIHLELLQEDVNSKKLIKEYNQVNKELFIQNANILREYLKTGSSKTVAFLIENK